MAKIKICGLTRMEDIEAVNLFKPDYAGFVFAPSKRQVTVAQVQKLCDALDPGIQRVGVFVNEDPKMVEQIRSECGLDIVQIIEDVQDPNAVYNGMVWRVVRVKDRASLSAVRDLKADAVLLDAYSPGAYGGTGERFDWELVREMAGEVKIVLAGGLRPDNVADAIRIAAPYAVDVSSGVEVGGVKDPQKIKQFIDNARRPR